MRRWAALLLLWILVPILLLGICEAGLRLAGYGKSLAPFRALNTPAGRAYVCDFDYLYSMFTRMPDTARAQTRYAIPAAKEPGTYRIFVFGSSAAFGWIHNASFAQMLQVMLMERFPGVRFEMYNLANGGLNSSLMRPLAKECAKMQPDAYVIYMGNNEVHGPYGLVSEYSVRQGRVLTPLEIRMQLKLRQFRLGQWITAAMNREEPVARVEHVPEELRPDDPRLAQIWRNYRSNMQSMFRSADKADAEVFISTLGANLRHWPPMTDLFWSEIQEEDRTRFAGFLEEGKAGEAAGAWDEALEAYRQAQHINDTSPYLLFRIANCLWALQTYDEAREYYAQALELDSFSWVRAKRAFNETIRSAADAYGGDNVVLVEGQARLEAVAPHATPGNESFADGCHLRPAGMYVLAKAFFEEMLPRMPEWVRKHEAPGAGVPDLNLILEVLGLTEHLQQDMLERLIRESREHGMDITSVLQAELDYIRAHPVTLDRVRQLRLTQKIVEAGTEDILFAHRFLECVGLVPGTYTGNVPDLVKRLSERYRLDQDFQHDCLELLTSRNDNEGRETVCRRLLELDPRDDPAYLNLGSLLAERGDVNEIRKILADAEKQGASETTCRYLTGNLLLLEEDPAALEAFTRALGGNSLAYSYAAEGLQEGLRRFPGTPEARQALVAYLDVTARDPEAHLAPERVTAMFDAWSVQPENSRLWEECVETRPDAVLCWLFLGMARERETRYPEARAAYEKVVELYPQNRTARYRLGSLEILHGDMDKGLSHLVSVVDANRQEASPVAETCANAADQFQKEGNFQAAVRLYEKALEIYPVNLWPRVNLGQTYELMGNTASAKEEYREALLVAPESPRAAGLVDVLMQETETPESVAAFWSALVDAHPESALPRLYLGKALEQLDRLDEARSNYGKVLEASPDSLESGYRMAALDMLAGSIDAGLKTMKEAAGKDPSLASDISRRLQQTADTFRQRGDPDTALRLYQAALDISPSDLWPRVRMGELHEEQGNSKAALDAYRAVLIEKPESPVTAGKMQAILVKMQASPETVLAEWKALTERHPGAAVPLCYLGDALQKDNRLDDAERSYQKAMEIEPGCAEASYRLGALQILDGDREAGLMRIKAAASKDPSLANQISARLGEIADIIRQRKDFQTAVTLYQTALDISPSDLWPRVRMGELHEEQGNNQAALDAYHAVLAEKPESPMTAGKIQAILVKMQASPETVLAEWKVLTERHPGAAVPLYYYANALETAGNMDEAHEKRRRAREINPGIEATIAAAQTNLP